MKKFIITILLITTGVVARSQDSTTVTQDKRPAIYWLFHNNYNLAMRYNDVAAAKDALYSLINIDPQNDSLRSNLAYLYFDNKQYPSTILACMDILANNPKHTPSLEMSAISYEELGLDEKAMNYYEKLYLITDNLETLYKLAYLQYKLKRYEESKVNLDILFKSPDLDNKKMIFQLSKIEQKEFPLRVAAVNLRGLVKQVQGDKEGAREDFNKALELAPDFIFAKNSLEQLDKN